jgi:hypothetical protein
MREENRRPAGKHRGQRSTAWCLPEPDFAPTSALAAPLTAADSGTASALLSALDERPAQSLLAGSVLDSAPARLLPPRGELAQPAVLVRQSRTRDAQGLLNLLFSSPDTDWIGEFASCGNERS